jgi:hypothetical protein
MNNFWQYLVEIDAWNGSGVETVKFCGKPQFDTGWYPYLVDPGLIRVEMFSGSKTSGRSRYNFGEIVVNNIADHAVGETTGPLDFLKGYSFDGREVRVYQGNYDDTYGEFILVYQATLEGATFEWQKILFTVRSRQAELDIPVDVGKFAGNNSLPAGVEGTESDLKDKPKPLLLGRVFNAQPVLCNTSKLIYAVSPSTGLAVTYMGAECRVYDNGVALTLEGTYTDQADMEANEPSPGCFKVWETGGYFRLGASPAGTVTFDGCSYGRSVNAKMSNLITDLLTLHDKQSMINSASFTAFADDVRYENGIYLSGTMPTISEVIDRFCDSCGAFWYFNSSGEMMLDQLEEPSSLSTDYELNSSTTPTENFSRQKSQDTPGGIPVHSLTLQYARNYSVATTFPGSVTDLRRAWLKEPWTFNKHEDGSILTAHPMAGEMAIETTFSGTAGGITPETIRRFGLYSVMRDIVSAEVELELFGSLANLRPGLCFNVNFSGRFGFINKKMVLVAFTVNHVDEKVILSLWG